MTDLSETKHERHRRSIRLQGYDYSENSAYFITICTRNREHLFGEIENGKMRLNDTGYITQQCWYEIPKHYPFVILDVFVVMPNHIHGIIVIERPIVVGANNHSPVPDDFMDKSESTYGFGAKYGFRAKDFSPLRKTFGTSMTIGAIVRGYKIGVTKWCRTHARTNMVWQRNYYEHIIRNDGERNAIREYIEKNPEMWEEDEMYT